MNLYKIQLGLPYQDSSSAPALRRHKDRWKQLTRSDRAHRGADNSTEIVQAKDAGALALPARGAAIASTMPDFEHSPRRAMIQVRYLDRDEHADVQQALQICGGIAFPSSSSSPTDGLKWPAIGERTLSNIAR